MLSRTTRSTDPSTTSSFASFRQLLLVPSCLLGVEMWWIAVYDGDPRRAIYVGKAGAQSWHGCCTRSLAPSRGWGLTVREISSYPLFLSPNTSASLNHEFVGTSMIDCLPGAPDSDCCSRAADTSLCCRATVCCGLSRIGLRICPRCGGLERAVRPMALSHFRRSNTALHASILAKRCNNEHRSLPFFRNWIFAITIRCAVCLASMAE